MYEKNLLSFFRNESGNTPVIIICITAVIIIIAAVLTDIGYVAYEHYKLSRCTSETAKIGATYAAWDRSKAVKFMNKYALDRINDLNSLNIKVSSSGKEITVNMMKHLDYLFLKYIGVKGKDIEAGITVKLSGMQEYKGIRPIAIKRQAFIFDREYSLVSSEKAANGEIPYLLLNLGGKDLTAQILYGFRKTLRAGSGVYALRGIEKSQIENGINQLIKKCRHKPECTYLNYQKDCSRIIIVPVTDNLNLDGSPMRIEGFAAFFLQGVKIDGGNLNIKGSFIRYTTDSATNDAVPDFGLLGVEVIK